MSAVRLHLDGWPDGILALTTTREQGASAAPWASFNLAAHVGDRPDAVAANRATLQRALPEGTRIQWLRQIHGTTVLPAGRDDEPEADACWSSAPGLACAVLTADCLPVLLAARDGSVVAAAHAGWRGLSAGILEATVQALPCAPDQLMAWLGPCIGPRAYRVGPEVRAAFVAALGDAARGCFEPWGPAGDRFHADLRGLAVRGLQRLGVTHIGASDHCTFGESQRYFSYRRDGETGRMATLIARVR